MQEVYSGVSRTAFLASVQWRNKVLRPVMERHLDSTAIMRFLGVWGHIFDNNFVLCDSIFFNRKWQDYVYIQCEYKSTKQKIKHLLREENKVKENKIS